MSGGKYVVIRILRLIILVYNSFVFANALQELNVTPSPIADDNSDNKIDTIPTQINNASTTDHIRAYNLNNELPNEIQKAVCTVTAGDVQASAEAFTTKTLKGVCGSDEMKLAFRNLEAKLFNEINEIKILIQQLREWHTLTPPIKSILNKVAPLNNTRIVQQASETKNTLKTKLISEIQKAQQKLLEMPKLSSSESQEQLEREKEISEFNNTLLTDRDFKIFTYYWKLENFTLNIKQGISKTTESSIFNIKGKPLQIKAIFQHLNRDYFYLKLNYAQLKKNNRNNIVLDMGGIFKQITQADNMIFKHKIYILDQNKHSKDLVSQEFTGMDMGFSIPNSTLLGSPYIKNDTLLIQVILYL